jgi:hypothetical protein
MNVVGTGNVPEGQNTHVRLHHDATWSSIFENAAGVTDVAVVEVLTQGRLW